MSNATEKWLDTESDGNHSVSSALFMSFAWSDPPRRVITKVRSLPSSSVSSMSNWRGAQFGAVYEAIKRMASLPEGHDLHITATAAQRAEDILGILSNNSRKNAPKVYPQEQDCVVFTWESPLSKQLLAVDEDEVDFMEINKSTHSRVDYDFDLTDDESLSRWIANLGGSDSSIDIYAEDA